MFRTLLIGFSMMSIGCAASAEGKNTNRILGYFSSCATAMETGETEGFSDLELETEVTSDTTLIRGWRGSDLEGLVVSLLRRFSGNSRMGMCDISFAPSPNNLERDQEILDAVAYDLNLYLDDLLADPNSSLDPNSMGRAIFTCVDGVAVSIFIDRENLDKGINAQVALVSRNKIDCG